MFVLEYDEPEMRRDVHLAMVAYWASVPMLAVYLAASWPRLDPGWPLAGLWGVVVASSAFLTVRTYPLAGKHPDEDEHDATRLRRRTWEWSVYPVTLHLVCLPIVSQTVPFYG